MKSTIFITIYTPLSSYSCANSDQSEMIAEQKATIDEDDWKIN
jgi:hypothetical protein